MATTLADKQHLAAKRRYKKLGIVGTYNPGAITVNVFVRKTPLISEAGMESAYNDTSHQVRLLQEQVPTAGAGGVVTIDPPEEFAGEYTLKTRLDDSGFRFLFQAKKTG